MSDSKKSDPGPLSELETSLAKLVSRDYTELADRLVCLVTLVAEEAFARPSFARKLAKALGESRSVASSRKAGGKQKRPSRRPSGVLDPFKVHYEGEAKLRDRLGNLDVEQLKDIIAEHGMNRDRLAMKWRTPGRLIDRIVETVRARVSKGDVFRD